jgi:PiT family inorganic phosphate transporter
MLELVYLILAAVVSFIIAANNSADSVGTLYGSRVTSYYKAAIFSGFFVMLGTLLEGWKMARAIGGGLVPNPLTLEMSLMVLLSTAILLFLFTYLSMPLSASQVLVGSIIGVAAAFAWLINIEFTLLVVSSWAITLLAAMGMAYLVYKLITLFAKKFNIFSISRFYTISLFIGSAFIAYTLGANTIGLVASLDLSYISIAIAGVASMLGTIFYGRKTVITVGKKITLLDPPRAFSAQLAGALVVELFTQIHFPVSITQAVIGGVIGTGLIKGYQELNRKTVKNLAASWIIAPLLAFALTYALVIMPSLHL